jgi:phosphatidate cytidylyltransferase
LLKQRLAVAAAGLPLLAGLLLLPERWFAALVTVLIAAGAIEFFRATPTYSERSLAIGAGASAALLAATLRTVEAVPDWLPLALLVLTAIALASLLSRWLGDPTTGAWWLGAVLYLGVLGAHWLLLRADDEGRSAIVAMLAVAFATDTGAYATGRLIGRHLLWPAVSPAKTWEGFAGGMLAGAVASYFLAGPLVGNYGQTPGSIAVLTERTSTWPYVVLLVIALPFAAIAGDLLESALKRRMEVKDMSGLLPGHGGLLDRMDSLLLVGPSLYWILQWAIPS